MTASFATPPRARIAVLAVLLAALLGVVGARLYVIQIIQHEHLGTRAEGQYERRIPVAAKRGTIYDRRGRVLVISLDAGSVFAHPGLVPEGKRYYPKKDLAAHLIGFAGVDNTGLEGLELAYERLLTGGPRSFMSRVDARGKVGFWEYKETHT